MSANELVHHQEANHVLRRNIQNMGDGQLSVAHFHKGVYKNDNVYDGASGAYTCNDRYHDRPIGYLVPVWNGLNGTRRRQKLNPRTVPL